MSVEHISCHPHVDGGVEGVHTSSSPIRIGEVSHSIHLTPTRKRIRAFPYQPHPIHDNDGNHRKYEEIAPFAEQDEVGSESIRKRRKLTESNDDNESMDEDVGCDGNDDVVNELLSTPTRSIRLSGSPTSSFARTPLTNESVGSYRSSSDWSGGRRSASRRKGHRQDESGDRVSKGLRHFSLKVCEMMRQRQRTTYSQVADDLAEELASNNEEIINPTVRTLDMDGFDSNGGISIDSMKSFSKRTAELNIRRRIYDALNVLIATDIIVRDGKEIVWVGLPNEIVSYNQRD